eukprot:TRINITY_DN55618_c0_g1_i1.p1 TRINITY_DN55618_c0_g1~~TRINITY_DN55618_c0_g1_i1.p1  ORF type:complete len:873 (-),score=252.07 TRINITY_DN55618_c0_g1_i1:151-2769(-)
MDSGGGGPPGGYRPNYMPDNYGSGASPVVGAAGPGGFNTMPGDMGCGMGGPCGSAQQSPGPSYATAPAQQQGMGGMGMGVMMSPQMSNAGDDEVEHGPVRFSQQEKEYYYSLFAYVDQQGSGFLQPMQGAQFLMSSGLPQMRLRDIWNLANGGNEVMTRLSFFKACRLVAHAQANNDMASFEMEPQALPDFAGVQRPPPAQRSPGAASALGARSDVSELQPVIGGVGMGSQSPAGDMSRRASGSARARSPSPRASTWAPTQRQKRKYAALFQRTDTNGDGYVEGAEAKDVVERSRMEPEVLRVVWEHADRDGDGRLDFREFVVLVHTVTLVLEGVPLPDPREGLADDLARVLATLEPVEVLVAEKEANRSRDHSPAASGRQSPAFLATPAPSSAAARTTPKMSPLPDPAAAAGNSAAFFNTAGSDFPTSGFPNDDWGAASGQQGDQNAFGSGGDGFASAGAWPGGGEGEGKKKKKKKDKDKDVDALAGGFGADAGGGGGDFGVTWADSGGLGGGGGFGGSASPGNRDALPMSTADTDTAGNQWDAFKPSGSLSPSRRGSEAGLGLSGQPPDLGHRRPSGAFMQDEAARERNRVQEQQLSAAAVHFEAVIEADRQLSKQLRSEVDELEEELRYIRETRDKLETQLTHEQRECEQLKDERKQLDKQSQDMKRRLQELRDARRSANLESISLRRDRSHFAEELAFLRRTVEDEERTIEAMRRANQFLDKSYRDLDAHTEELERQRRELAKQVQREKDLQRQEERQNADLRNRLERMRRERVASANDRRQGDMRDMAVREMQGANVVHHNGGVQVPSRFASGARDHTWAPGVFSSDDPISSGGLGSNYGARSPGAFGTAPRGPSIPSSGLLSRPGV